MALVQTTEKDDHVTLIQATPARDTCIPGHARTSTPSTGLRVCEFKESSKAYIDKDPPAEGSHEGRGDGYQSTERVLVNSRSNLRCYRSHSYGKALHSGVAAAAADDEHLEQRERDSASRSREEGAEQDRWLRGLNTSGRS